MGKAYRLDTHKRGWSGQKYMRKLASKARRRLESKMLRSPDYEGDVPKIPAKGRNHS